MNYVQAFITNISFPAKLDQLLDFLIDREEINFTSLSNNEVFLLRPTGAANDPNRHGSKKGFAFDFAL